MDALNITIGISAYNEASTIFKVVSSIRESGFDRVVVVDDGSSDDTANEARKAGARVLQHAINGGAGAGVQTILLLAKKEKWPYLLLMDADGQHSIEHLEDMFCFMKEKQIDILIGNRFSSDYENEVPGFRRIYNRLANVMTNVFCEKNYGDTQSGYRLLNQKAIEELKLKSTGFGYCSEMIWHGEQKGLVIAEYPISVLYTEYSQSKGQTNLFNGLKTAWQFLENI